MTMSLADDRYTLRYFFDGKWEEHQVRIEHGTMLAFGICVLPKDEPTERFYALATSSGSAFQEPLQFWSYFKQSKFPLIVRFTGRDRTIIRAAVKAFV
jgi:hypothetical protein